MNLLYFGEEDLHHLYYHRYLIATSAAAAELIYYKLLPLTLLRLMSYLMKRTVKDFMWQMRVGRQLTTRVTQVFIQRI